MKDVSAQIFLSARFAVDTFFFISGFLVALSLLRRLSPTVSDASSHTSHSHRSRDEELSQGQSEEIRGRRKDHVQSSVRPISFLNSGLSSLDLGIMSSAFSNNSRSPYADDGINSSSGSSSRNGYSTDKSNKDTFPHREEQQNNYGADRATAPLVEMIDVNSWSKKSEAFSHHGPGGASAGGAAAVEEGSKGVRESVKNAFDVESASQITRTSSEFPSVASVESRGTNETMTFQSMLQWLPAFYMHRLLRILPPYAFCLLLWWKIAVLLGSGPYWNRWLDYSHQCDQYFWTNFLFINNLYPYVATETSECFLVSWYLADDMQFYLVSPFFAVLYLKSARLGLGLTLLTCVLSSVAAAWGTYEGDWSAHSFDGLWVTKYAILFYTKPHMRIPPYCIGMASAMIWHYKSKFYPNYVVPKNTARLLLLVSTSILFYLIFGAYSAYQNRCHCN